jgi:hypothetical protein
MISIKSISFIDDLLATEDAERNLKTERSRRNSQPPARTARTSSLPREHAEHLGRGWT